MSQTKSDEKVVTAKTITEALLLLKRLGLQEVAG